MTSSFPVRSARTQGFTLGAPRNFTISSDGSKICFLRSGHGEDPVNQLWLFDFESGAETQLLDPADLHVDGGELSDAERARRERLREGASGITSYDICSSFSHAAASIGGSIAIVDIGARTAHLIDAPAGAYDPRISPDGNHVAYVVDGALILWSENESKTLAADPHPDITYGIADFAAAEEMRRTRGFWWSPDSNHILVTRVDNTGVEQRHLADPTEPTPSPRTVRYPGAGTPNAVVDVLVIDLDGNATEIDWRSDKFEYLATASWKSSSQIALSAQTRNQRIHAILKADPTSGAIEQITAIEDDDWVELLPGSPSWAGDTLITIRPDQDTYRVFANETPISPIGLQVASVISSKEDDGPNITYMAAPDPLERHIYNTAPDGTTTQLTHGVGVHRAIVRSKTRLTISQSPDKPGTKASVTTGDGESVTIGSLAADPELPLNIIHAKLGERELRTAILTPTGHDGNSKLPVFMRPYGGPHAQRVLANYNSYLTAQWFADQGFAVIICDGRGTPARGPAWEREVAGDLATAPLQDQVDALAAAAAEFDFIDTDRVAISGWSFGGYLAALAVLRRPDVFHAAVAGAPVTDWELYDTHYTERYLGDPATAPEQYSQSALTADAPNLSRPLMLIHGLADDNVFAAHTLQFSRSLLEAGRPHTVLPLSAVSHMTPQEKVAENLLRLELDFVRQSLA